MYRIENALKIDFILVNGYWKIILSIGMFLLRPRKPTFLWVYGRKSLVFCFIQIVVHEIPANQWYFIFAGITHDGNVFHSVLFKVWGLKFYI
jgi:hypothetical protein